jgi:hypothetical protein
MRISSQGALYMKDKYFLDKEPLSPYLFDHKSHPGTKIVRHPGGRVEYCCPYNGPVDDRGNPLGPNLHFESAQAEAIRQAYRKNNLK